MKARTLAFLTIWLCQTSMLRGDEPQSPVLRFVDRAPVVSINTLDTPESSRRHPDEPSYSLIDADGQVIPASMSVASEPVNRQGLQTEPPNPQDSAAVERQGWKPLSDINIRVNLDASDVPTRTVTRPAWDQTESQLIASGGDRGTNGLDVCWEPTELWYRPLYFEDTNLERYGFRYSGIQPLASAAHFFGRVPVLPYLRGTDPAHQQVTALGHRRPGSPDMLATRGIFQPSLRGSLYQAGATVGGVFLVP